MNILIVYNGLIPVTHYGGTERVICSLGKELARLGHSISFLVKQGSKCDFGTIISMDDSKRIIDQIPANIDIVHFNATPKDLEELNIPYVITIHGNTDPNEQLAKNIVFVSSNHAQRHGSSSYIDNGLDWDDYPTPNLSSPRSRFHFLAKAAWRVKNVQGAIDVIKQTKHEKLDVLGGHRFNMKMGVRLTFSPRIRFYGMVGMAEKAKVMQESKGLIFPVKWHEPFGLAIIERLYYGCPVFGTTYGSLPELVNDDVGHLSNSVSGLAKALETSSEYSQTRCHNYARDLFNAKAMAHSYIEKYNAVLNGECLNTKPPQIQMPQTEKFLPWNA